MYDLLMKVEAMLPYMLTDPLPWNSLDVDYHPPRVERLWWQWDSDHRVYLHCIHPCGEEDALLHPHPWPSVIRVCDRGYIMLVSYENNRSATGPIIARQYLPPGSWYEMTHPAGRHAVVPKDGPSLSVMVTGKPWGRGETQPRKRLLPLSPERCLELLGEFRTLYPRPTPIPLGLM